MSVKSGRVYDSRLIRKYLEAHDNQDPLDGTVLDPEHDLVSVMTGASDPRGAAPPRGAHLTSVPSLLTALQSEYDSLLLEMVSLKRQYDATRQELAAALYSNDAASRVIARVLRERDEARQALESIGQALPSTTAPASATAPASDAEMPDASDAPSAPSGLPAKLVETVESLAAQLTQDRKGRSKRKAPAVYGGLAAYTAANQSGLETKSSVPISHPVQLASVYPPYALVGASAGSVDVLTTEGNTLGSLPLPDGTTISSLALALPAQPALGQVAALPPFAVAASADGRTAYVVSLQDTIRLTATFPLQTLSDAGDAPVVALAVHPSHAFFALGRGRTVALFVPEGGDAVLVMQAEAGERITSAAFHPDGGLLATGTVTGKILVWDVKTGARMALFEPTGTAAPQDGHAVHALAFSENGYTLASIAEGSLAAVVWDLRKLAPVATLTLAATPTSLAFDPNAQLLVLVAPGELTLYATKGWKPLLTSPLDTEATPVAVGWDPQSANLSVVLSRREDAVVSTYGPPSSSA